MTLGISSIPWETIVLLILPEPFDTASWMLVGIVAIHAATIMILLFEWLSPSGFNMKVNPSDAEQKLVLFISLLITYVCFLAPGTLNSHEANHLSGPSLILTALLQYGAATKKRDWSQGVEFHSPYHPNTFWLYHFYSATRKTICSHLYVTIYFFSFLAMEPICSLEHWLRLDTMFTRVYVNFIQGCSVDKIFICRIEDETFIILIPPVIFQNRKQKHFVLVFRILLVQSYKYELYSVLEPSYKL